LKGGNPRNIAVQQSCLCQTLKDWNSYFRPGLV